MLKWLSRILGDSSDKEIERAQAIVRAVAERGGGLWPAWLTTDLRRSSDTSPPAPGVRARPWTTSFRRPSPLVARGGQAHDRPAPLRRAADRRHRAAPGQDRRDDDRRRQDAGRHPAALPQCAGGSGAHLVTLNDYLAKRDAQWMGPVYHLLGLSVGVIQHEAAFLFDPACDRPRPAPAAPAAGRAPRGLPGRHHLRHEQRVRLRLPARQHGGRPGPAARSASCTTPSSTRWTTSSSTRRARR